MENSRGAVSASVSDPISLPEGGSVEEPAGELREELRLQENHVTYIVKGMRKNKGNENETLDDCVC